MPAGENPTVAMMEAAYAHHDLNWRYINCEVAPECLGAAARGAMAMGWQGFNCSLPHKVAIIDHLDALGESAAIIGAVNTVVREDARYIGENTDGRGFVAALHDTLEPKGKSVMVLGAGGAARAIAVELALAGAASVEIINRDPMRGRSLVATLNARTPAAAAFRPWRGQLAVPAHIDLLVNATPVGLYPHVRQIPDVDITSLRPEMVVADGIHNPPRTRFLQAAAAKGCQTVDGLAMPVGQGALGFRYWTGLEPEVAVMHRALQRIFDRHLPKASRGPTPR